MCDPLTATAAAVTGAGSLFSGFSGSRQAKQNAAIARSNAELARKAAEVQRIGADTAGRRGAFEEGRIRREVDRTVRGATTHYAARNLDTRFGSPLLIAAITAANGEIDAQLARTQGQIERATRLADAASTEAQGANATAEAGAHDRSATTNLVSGVFGAATATLSGFADQWPGLSLGSASGQIGLPSRTNPYGGLY